MKFILCELTNLEKEFVFELDNSTKDIGVWLSGGLDSSILTCLIIEYILKNKLDINLYTFSACKPTLDHLYGQRLSKIISTHYNFPIKYFGNLINKDGNGRLSLLTIINLKRIFSNIQFFLAGNNPAPPEISGFEKTLGIRYSVNDYYKLPFLDLYKPHILDLLYKLNAEFIIKYSHTCCVQAVGNCRHCYSCLERNWAFQFLGKQDINCVEL